MQIHRVLRVVCVLTVSFLLIGTTVAWSQEGSYAAGKQTGERQWHGMMASPEQRALTIRTSPDINQQRPPKKVTKNSLTPSSPVLSLNEHT